MTPEWLAAIASIGTFVVIAATAVAALVQLRHMRSSNQIAALNELRETIESEYFRSSAEFVHKSLPDLLNDNLIRHQIAAGTRIPAIKELTPAATMADFFEQCGMFIKHGIIEPRLFCDLWSYNVLICWEAIAPLVINLRTIHNQPALWENFEYLVTISKAWHDQHPDGNYPTRATREVMPALWPEVTAAVSKRDDAANITG
ncbi:MAG: hypothetical protein JO177_01005 [Candidatus Eremiobacteraeota bacterium]|nr:hypothetical protein [Candidatus Eremiobacteraeota bacterium]